LRRHCSFLLAIGLLLTLCGCGLKESAIDSAQSIRIKALSAESVEMKLTLRADYGERAFDCELLFSGDENDGTVTVISPESVKDLTVKIKDGKSSTEFDGVSLYMGEIEELCETPACAAAVFLDAWKNGYITDCKYETLNGIKTVAVTSSLDEIREVRTWFNEETLLPVYAELLASGKTVIFCSISNVLYK